MAPPRFLQATGAPGTRVAVWPDFEVGIIVLTDHRVIVLGRNAALPPACTTDSYCFDSELDADALRDARAQARELEAVLGGHVEVAGADASAWRVSDPAH